MGTGLKIQSRLLARLIIIIGEGTVVQQLDIILCNDAGEAFHNFPPRNIGNYVQESTLTVTEKTFVPSDYDLPPNCVAKNNGVDDEIWKMG